MKIILLFLLLFVFRHSPANCQIYTTLKGHISFSSHAKEESIEAHNYNVAVQLLAHSGKGQFIIPVKSFRFKKALMEEHFNEDYMESDTYTKATYKYDILSSEKVNLNRAGRYHVTTKGIMTIKNTSRNIEIAGDIVVIDDNNITLDASFSIHPADYDIRIPRLVEKKIADSIDVRISTALKKQ